MNLGSLDSGLGEIGVCWETGFVASVLIGVSGVSSEVLSGIVGMVVEISELDLPPEAALPTGDREGRLPCGTDVEYVVVEVFRPIEGAESLSGINFLLQSWQILFRSSSSSSESDVTR